MFNICPLRPPHATRKTCCCHGSGTAGCVAVCGAGDEFRERTSSPSTTCLQCDHRPIAPAADFVPLHVVIGRWRMAAVLQSNPPRPFDGAEWSFCHCRNTFESRAGGCLPRRRRQLYSPEPLSSLSTHILRMPFADNPVMCSYIIASVRCSRRGLLRNTCTLATPRFLPICRSFL